MRASPGARGSSRRRRPFPHPASASGPACTRSARSDPRSGTGAARRPTLARPICSTAGREETEDPLRSGLRAEARVEGSMREAVMMVIPARITGSRAMSRRRGREKAHPLSPARLRSRIACRTRSELGLVTAILSPRAPASLAVTAHGQGEIAAAIDDHDVFATGGGGGATRILPHEGHPCAGPNRPRCCAARRVRRDRSRQSGYPQAHWRAVDARSRNHLAGWLHRVRPSGSGPRFPRFRQPAPRP